MKDNLTIIIETFSIFCILHIILYKMLYWYIVCLLATINIGDIEVIRRLAKKDKMWRDVLLVIEGEDK